MNKVVVKKTLLTVVALLIAFVVIAGCYVLYVVISYRRLPDNLSLDVVGQRQTVLSSGGLYKIATFNIGFGAYDHDFSFFMDSGVMKDGTAVKGEYAKARSRDVVMKNTSGAIASSKALDVDFLMLQEVDIKSTRSYKVNQLDIFAEEFSAFSHTFAYNYQSAYLFYPFNDPIGKSVSGIATFSKYKVDSAVRRSLPLSTGFSKFFDLDRCIMVSRLPVSDGKQLVLVNVHLSAYDEGGLIRKQQLQMLNEILTEEYTQGNYVVVGGDFNHDIADSENVFATQQRKPEWVYTLTDSDLPAGFAFAKAVNAPTCRSTDLPYTKGVNYTVVIDGFILSDNIYLANVSNIDLDFVNSDHNPVLLQFGFM